MRYAYLILTLAFLSGAARAEDQTRMNRTTDNFGVGYLGNISPLVDAIKSIGITQNTFNGVPSTTGYISDLVVSSQSTSSDIITISARAVDVQGVLVMNLSTTCSLALSGQGGLDTGSRTQNTWYSFFATYSSGTGVPGCILSASSVTPAVSLGTLTRRLGWVYNNNSNAIVPFYQVNDVMLFWTPQTLLDAGSLSVNTSPLEVDLSSAVPPSARAVFTGQKTSNSTGQGCRMKIRSKGIKAGNIGDDFGYYDSSSNASKQIFTRSTILLGPSQRILVSQRDSGDSAVDSAQIDIYGAWVPTQ